MFVSNDMFNRWYDSNPNDRAVSLQTRPLYRTPIQLHAVKQRQSQCLVYDMNAPDFYGGFTQMRRISLPATHTVTNDVRAFSLQFRSRICGVAGFFPASWLASTLSAKAIERIIGVSSRVSNPSVLYSSLLNSYQRCRYQWPCRVA